MLYVFDRDQSLIDEVLKRDIKEAYYVEQINTPKKLYASFVWGEDDEAPRYIAHKDLYNANVIRLYYINKIDRKDQFVIAECIESAYDELNAYPLLFDRRPRNQTLRDIFNNYLLTGIDWQLGVVEPTAKFSTNFYYESVLSGIQKLINKGIEVDFTCTVHNGSIQNKRINIYNQLGEDRGKRFAWGDGLLEVTKTQQKETIYTALVPTGKKEERTHDDGTVTEGYNISIANAEWRVSEGDPIDKPLGQRHIELPDRTAIYGLPNGKPRYGFINFPDEESPEEILRLGYEELLRLSRPQVQFKADVQDTGDTQLGDTVSIIKRDIGIEYKTRIFKRTVDLLDTDDVEGEANYG